MMNFFIGLGVGVACMFLIQRALHNWYMGQITGLCHYVTSLQQEVWDARFEQLSKDRPVASASVEHH